MRKRRCSRLVFVPQKKQALRQNLRVSAIKMCYNGKKVDATKGGEQMHILITGAMPRMDELLESPVFRTHTVSRLPCEWDPLPVPYECVEGIIGNGIFLHHPIERFTSLCYIQLTSAGADRVPLEVIRRAGITLHTARGVYDVPMAEFAVTAVLSICKRWDFFRDNQRAHRWEKHRGLWELGGRRVCIVGCGSVGSACAERFCAFGCRVRGIDRSPRADRRYEAMRPPQALAEELSAADVVILSLPLDGYTHHLIGRRELSLLRQGCILVNLARGAVVDTAALTEVLSRRAVYAVLDVQETEPLPPDSPLWDMENVFLTPHNSFVGEGNDHRLGEVVCRNLAAFAVARSP